MNKKHGKYSKHPGNQRKKDGIITKILVGIIVFLTIVVIAMLWFVQGRSPYQKIVHDGYTGIQEQWLASLVGEEVDDNVDTAYNLAVKNGYRGSEAEWIETIVGISADDVDMSLYKLACEHGFEGSLSEWLTSIADNSDTLGRSENGERKTEYELACEYGYSGTFIEWLVSVTNDRVFE